MWKAYSAKSAKLADDKAKLKEYRLACKMRRRKNVKTSTKILKDANISFIQHTEFHYKIETGAGVIDFYPSTGRYLGVYKGRGIFNLLKILKNL